MATTRSKFCIAFVLGLASAVGVAIAAEPARKRIEAHAVALPMEPGPDGWYDASPPDGFFKVRMPGVYRGFAEDGTTDAGAVTHTIGVRADLRAAFGSTVTYVASCIQQKGDERNAKERLQSSIDKWEKLKGTMRYRKQIDSASQRGFEFEREDAVKVMRARVYAPAEGTCTSLIIWTRAAKPSDADIEKFFSSFALAKR